MRVQTAVTWRNRILKIQSVLLVLGVPACLAAQDSSWALTHASIIDVAAGKVINQQTVYIRNGQIVVVGATEKIQIPPSVRRVDAAGLFILPGLFNMHTHMFGAGGLRTPPLKKYVAAGVLGVRDLGSPLEDISAIAKDRTSAIQPAIWFSGPIIDAARAPNPSSYIFRYVNTDEEARTAVLSLAQRGVDFIKVHDWLPRTIYLAIAESARNQNLPLVGHVPAAVSIDDAIVSGQKSIEHLGGLTHAVLRGCSQTDTKLQQELLLRGSKEEKGPAYQLVMSSEYITPMLNVVNWSRCAALVNRLARAKVWQVPTLVLW